MSDKKKILVIQKVHEKGMELFKNHPNFEVDVTDDVSVENLKSKIKDCDGASIRIANLPGEVIEEAKNLKIISRHGVGYDNIDLKKAKEKDVKIAITANANAVTVAEHVMFVLLHIAKRKNLFDKTVRDGNFKDRNKLPKTIEISSDEPRFRGNSSSYFSADKTIPLAASATTSRISYPSEFSPQLSASAFDIFCMIWAFEYVGSTIPLSTVIEISSPSLKMMAETGTPGVPLKDRLPSPIDSWFTSTSFTEINLSPTLRTDDAGPPSITLVTTIPSVSIASELKLKPNPIYLEPMLYPSSLIFSLTIFKAASLLS